MTFRATPGSKLWIQEFTGSNGQGMAIAPGTSNELIMRFAVPTRRLSLVFGNDLGTLQDGDRATLRLYRSGRRVATVSMEPNENVHGDQEIQYEGSAITKATFAYTRGGVPISDAAEVVDDIRLDEVCTIRGTRGPNRLVGTAKANGICGLAGSDRLFGRAGNDVLVGGKGNDRLNGDAGNDLLVGGNGNDTLRTTDGVSGNDTVYGGEGDDTCIIDAGDIHFGCETITEIAP